MSDIDTSFYTKAQPNSLLENVQGALQARNLGQQNQLLGTENQQKSLELIQQRQAAFNNMTGALINDPNLSYDKVLAEGQRAVDLGMFGPDLLKTEAAIFSPNDPPEVLRQKLTSIVNRSMQASDLLNRYNGQPTAINTGSATVTGNLGVGGFTPNTSIASGLSPGEASTPTEVPALGPTGQPTGATTLTTRGNFVNAANATGGITGASPQQLDLNKASGEQFANAKASAANYQADILPLHKMLDLLPNTTTGLGSEGVQNLNRLLATFGVSIAGSGQQAANYSEVEKYATQLARSAGAAPNSDQQLQAAFAANPGTATDNAAAQKVVKTLLTYRRMQQAMTLNAVNSGITPEGYADYIAKAGANTDPRAFGFDLMTPLAKQQLGAELEKDKSARAKFLASYKIAQQAGVLGQ